MHHDKCNIGNAAGGRNLLDHDKRERNCARSNENIDPSRSHLNVDYSARKMSAADAWEYACNRAQEHSPRKLRDNTVVMAQDVIHLPNNWSELYPDRDPSEFFEKVALPFCRERWGGGEGHPNEISAVVHYDETLVRGAEGMPHLHYKSVPITEDGRLSHKDIYNRKSLTSLHPDLSRFAEDRGYRGLNLFDQERAKVRERALTMPEYKDAQREMDEIRERLEGLRQSERELEERNRELARERDEARERVVELEQDRAEARSRVEEVSEERREPFERCEALERERDNLESRVGELERNRDEAVERVHNTRGLRDWISERIERLEEARDKLAERARDIASCFQQVLDHAERLFDKAEDMLERSHDQRLTAREERELVERGEALNERAWDAETRLEQKFATLKEKDADRLRSRLDGWLWNSQREIWEEVRSEQRGERSRSMLDREMENARAAADDARHDSHADDYVHVRDSGWGRGR